MLEVSLVAGEHEAGCRLLRQRSIVRLALNQNGLVQMTPGPLIDEVDVAVNAMIHAPGVKQVPHVEDPPFDEIDPCSPVMVCALTFLYCDTAPPSGSCELATSAPTITRGADRSRRR